MRSLEFRRLEPSLAGAFGRFLLALGESGAGEHFHPHPLTAEEAQRLAAYDGQDLYYVISDGETILGYGMLRGWDEGFDVPSLGIAIHPSTQGSGLGRAFMYFLHAAARARAAKRIRLKVHRTNARAQRLYTDLGYEFTGEQDNQLVGYVAL
jgi:ribosomal protein S18 acetylase RimI-like enzyme